jgi:serine/threonine protein phosphatase 1
MIYVIGDIHGTYDPLKILVDYIFDKSKQGEQINRVIFLGDYVDFGPSSKEVVDLILKVKAEFETITLLGNHEEMLLSFYSRAFNYQSAGNMWLNFNGGIQTIRNMYPQSVLFRSKQELNEKVVSDLLQYDNVFKLEPVYSDFFYGLQTSFQTSIAMHDKEIELLFSHSVPSPRFPLAEQLEVKNWAGLQEFVRLHGCNIEETLVWNRQLLNQQLQSNMIVIHGHTPTRYYRQMTRLLRMWEEDETAPYVGREKKSRNLVQIDIDTGLIYGGSLTMLVIDDAPDAGNLFPYYISIDLKKGLRHKLFQKQELNLL